MRFAVRSLRGRLIAGLLVLLTVACAIVGLVTTLAIHAYLVGRLDQQLTAAAAAMPSTSNIPVTTVMTHTGRPWAPSARA